MSFISYAQNFEDVMIWRALKHVENGFYIDVGANDPTLYSVTRAFYDKGWHGINLEPVAEFFNRLAVQRPRDINLQLGAGDVAGSFPFFDIPDTGLATADPDIAQKHRDGGCEVNAIDIAVWPLSEVCSSHVSGDIHFLKIDVEGAEKKVLLGMDFKKWRPWLIIIEATAPMSQEPVHQSWEFLLTNSAYEFVYFDGLNRYYVAEEHAELKPAFATPPNVFDNFVLPADHEAKTRATEAEHRVSRAELEIQTLKRLVDEATEQAKSAQLAVKNAQSQTDLLTLQHDALAAQLAATLASTSWRWTQPLRVIASKLKVKAKLNKI